MLTRYLYKINWTINKIYVYALNLVFNIFIKKDSNILLSGCKFKLTGKEVFNYNSKYLFLYITQNYPDMKFYWLCDDKNMLREFHKRGFKNVVSRRSPKGIWAILTAKYWFCDLEAPQISEFCSKNSAATIINLWHGSSGLKKVQLDNKDVDKNKIKLFLNYKYSYHVVNSDYEAECRKSAFNAKNNEIKFFGSPRLDILYKNIENAEIFMDEDFTNIKRFKEQGKTIILYTPTFRDTGKNISSWLKAQQLKDILKNNNAVLVCKLHPRDNNSLNFKLPEEIYEMNKHSDIYPVLRFSDALITDYSSIYFDYLHLNKPIIYHIPDLDEYQKKCRGFYRPYETLIAGICTRTDDELFKALIDAINGIDNYEEQRKNLLNEMFITQDGNNCERIVKWIRSLD